MGEQENGNPHYCNARYAEKDHDSIVGKGKKGAGKGSKRKLMSQTVPLGPATTTTTLGPWFLSSRTPSCRSRLGAVATFDP